MKTTFNVNLLFPVVVLGILLLFNYFVITVPLWLLIAGPILSYPFKIDGNIFSLWGGINHTKGGSVYSLFGIYQIANRDAISITGILIYQKAGEIAGQWFGVACIQRATNSDVYQLLGLSFYQETLATEESQRWKKDEDWNWSGQFFGIALYQSAGIESCMIQLLGIVIFRKAAAFYGWGIPIFQRKLK